ncbi:MAG: DMT family transporter [Candidatus Promineifilaceae bacterium]
MKKHLLPPPLVLVVGILAVSVSAILIRFAQGDAPSLVIAAGRTTIASLLLLPFCLGWRRAELQRMSRTEWRLALLAGALLGVHFASWISSLAYTTVASSTVLVTTSPLWVGIASPFLLKEKMSRSLIAGIALALAGSAIIALWDVGGGGGGGSRPLLGNFLALVGAWMAAIYLIIGRRLRAHLSLLTYTTVVYGTAALFLLAAVILSGYPLIGYEPRTLALFLLMALGPQLLGHSSFNWALAFLPASYVAVTLVSEPIGSSLLAYLFFQEKPGTGVWIGGSLIILGLLAASLRRDAPITPQ